MSTPQAKKQRVKSIDELEGEVDKLHVTFERMGKNSTGVTDIFGREFIVPVDAEHKATQDPLMKTLCVCGKPHMAAFHSSWFGFFASFYSTFAAAALGPYIIPDLDLSDEQWGLSGTMAVTGTIVFRLTMGWICEKFGARKGLSYLLLGTIPAIVIMMFVQSAWQFILMRCIIGFSLATFVACQTWMSQMFSKSIVGIANATAAGWGNLGGGITNLTMPYIFLMMMSFTGNNESTAWRMAYIVPILFHLVAGLNCLLRAQDLPDGNYKELELSGAKAKADSGVVIKVGFSNINAWILTITYGMCFGIELTMNNVAARYFYAYQGFTPQMAGIAASCWGLMNLFARSCGGWISDWANKKAGMRGRLWATWAVQTLEGVFCILLGWVTIGYDAPNTDKTAPKIPAWVKLPDDWLRQEAFGTNLSGWTDIHAACFGLADEPKDLLVQPCNTLNLELNDAMKECLKLDGEFVLRQTPPSSYGVLGLNGEELDCINHSGTAGIVMILVVCFSFCVQAAEGLHYGVVPYVSKAALGVVSGMVGAGGNTGALVMGLAFFKGGSMRTDQAIIYMGIVIIALTGLLFFVYFPDKGGMLVKAGGLGWYDPQIIKPPEGYKGADEMDFAAAEQTLNQNKKNEGQSHGSSASSTTTSSATYERA